MLAKAGYPLTYGVSALPLPDQWVFGGYIQTQYESHQQSEDQLAPGGALLNQDRFVIRRGRLAAVREWEWARILIEFDGNTNNGPILRFQKVEASLIYGRSKDRDQPPLAQFTVGQFYLPFGFESPYGSKSRLFMERSQVSRALWPGEPDVGAWLSGGFDFTRYSVAVTNGEPADQRAGFPLRDPNAAKDVTARVGAQTKASRDFVIAGGVSYNRGKGFTPGTDATKNSLGWNDVDGNQTVAENEIVGQAARGVTLSRNFDRWAVGADLQVLLHSALGWSMLYGEVVAATNLDRGYLPSDPNVGGAGDIRQLGYYAAFTQEITPYGVVGFRYDFYDPNSDITDTRRGKILPAEQRVKTYSPLVGLILPGRAKLLFQYDFIRDFLGRDNRGVPTDFKNDQWTLRLQLNL